MTSLLRPWTRADLDSLVRHANSVEVAKTMIDAFPHPFTRSNAEFFLRSVQADNPTRVLAISIDGEAVGAISLVPLTDIWRMSSELGYWLAHPFWGKGIATRAVLEMIEYGFGRLPINRIFARPFASNIGSQRVLEKAGLKLEGRFEKAIFKNGVYEDELLYAVLRP